MTKLSTCCDAGFGDEPGWPDWPFCSRCGDHADAWDDENILDSSEFMSLINSLSSKEAENLKEFITTYFTLPVWPPKEQEK